MIVARIVSSRDALTWTKRDDDVVTPTDACRLPGEASEREVVTVSRRAG